MEEKIPPVNPEKSPEEQDYQFLNQFMPGFVRAGGFAIAFAERTLSTAEAAERLGVSKKTLLKYCREHYITYMRYPGGEFRFRESVLEMFQARCTIKAKS